MNPQRFELPPALEETESKEKLALAEKISNYIWPKPFTISKLYPPAKAGSNSNFLTTIEASLIIFLKV